MGLTINNEKGKRKQKADTLQSRVLKLSIANITDPKFFKKEVYTIPMKFQTVDQYRQIFRAPLLEEVRAQLYQALEKNLNLGNILRMKITKVKTSQSKEEHIFVMHSSTPVVIRVLDIILLCNEAPKWDAKQECIAHSLDPQYILASVIHAEESSQFITATSFVEEGSSILENMSSWRHAVMLGSLIPAQRIWDSLQKAIPENKLPQNMSVIQSVLRIEKQPVPTGIKDLLLPQTTEMAAILQHVQAYCNSRNLNKSQTEAITSALAGLFTVDTRPHVRMVQGPPGTGKTALLITLLSILGCLHCRTLVSAPTNAAVLEIAKRMMGFFQIPLEGEIQQKMFSSFNPAGKVGQKSSSTESRGCWPIELSEVVLVGSEERMEGAVDGTMLEDIFLPYRVKRLLEALGPTTGWNACIQSLKKFMTNVPDAFENMKKGISKDAPQCGQEEKKRKSKSKQGRHKKGKENSLKNALLWSFARGSFVKMQAQLQQSASVLTSELPKCYLDMPTRQAMHLVNDLMRRLMRSMPWEAPLDAASWFTKSIADTLPQGIAKINLDTHKKPTFNLNAEFLQEKERLLEILSSNPGCNLLKSKENPQGCVLEFGWLRSQCFQNATLVLSTVSAAGGTLMKDATFECGVIDEASQLVEAETTIITSMSELKQLILVGDHRQLPATVISKVAGICGYGRSLFDRLQSLQHGCRHFLNIQYRMKPAISRFPFFRFYERGVEDGPNVISADYGRSLYQCSPYGPYAFLDCVDGKEVAEKKSWTNPIEVQFVLRLVQRFDKVCAERNIRRLSIGVISPYSMQVEAVKQSLQAQNLSKAIDMQVKTVDGFQGNERDVIIFTAVRANYSKNIGFVNDCRRLNVAITRGRYCVWIVGNAQSLSRGGKIWKKLICDAKERKCFHTLRTWTP